MGWKRFQEVANTKPLFTAIYATVIVGVIFSSFYVFSAIYSANSAANSKISWLSAPSVSFSTPTRQELNFSRSATVDTVLGSTPGPQTLWVPPIWAIPPRTEKMPPLKTFRLSKELVQKRVKDNIIVVTFGNYAFMDFILTWVKHLTDLGLSNLLVGAMDAKLLEALYWKGVPVFYMGSHMSTIDVGWGSPTFHKMGREKVILIDSILPFGYELLMCDTDMVWLKNPLPYLARHPGADVLTSSDQVIPTVVDDSLDIWQQGGNSLLMIGMPNTLTPSLQIWNCPPTNEIFLDTWKVVHLFVSGAYNIGIFHWRPTHSAKKLASEWKDMLLANEKIWDQNGFNDIVHRQLGPSVDEDSGLVYAFDGQLKLGILPASIFCSGHTYFVQTMYRQLQLEPYAVHTTFQYEGTEGKRHRLLEAMFFYDPPDYYDSPGGFLSFRPSIPKSLLLDGEHNIESHFSLVNYQIKQIRTALAIALLLNRTLRGRHGECHTVKSADMEILNFDKVKIQYLERLDRLWFPHPGVLEVSMTRQPFLCPLDHVFEVNIMLKGLPEEEFGPGIDIREYSFLDNPSVPEKVRESWLDVQLCQGTQDCHAFNDTGPPGIIRFPKRSNEETFKSVYSSFRDVKVIQFSSMQDAFQGLGDKTREQRFRNRVKRYVGLWCCVDNHTPGHIYYDMYWDEKPGWKPIPPQTPEDDHPPL